MNASKTYPREGKVTVDELAGMTKRRFDELEDEMGFRFDHIDTKIMQIETRLSGVESKVDILENKLDALTKTVIAGFKSLKALKSK